MKIPAFLTTAPSLGDLICTTPTIRKLSEVYSSKVIVISPNPQVLEGLPYVAESLHIDSVDIEHLGTQYDLHKTFHLLGKADSLGIEFKHAICDIRQFHAKDLGILLKKEELTCDYKAKEPSSSIDAFGLPENYVVVHPVQSWGSRTWSIEEWQILINGLEEAGKYVVCVGKDSGEYTSQGNLDKPAYKIDLKNGKDLTNKTSLDQTWHILNGAESVITMDSGVLHLAGTTDVKIFQLGSSIDPEYRAPYRHGTQDYKYTYIPGTCNIFCASDLRYSLRDWGSIQNVTLIDTCLEPGKNFECKPTSKKALEKILNSSMEEEQIKPNDSKVSIGGSGRLIKIQSRSLGDIIGAMSVIESYRNDGEQLTVICNLDGKHFKKSYPFISTLPHEIEPIPDNINGVYTVGDKSYSEFTRIYYDFHKPLMQGYADQLGVKEWNRPKIDLFESKRPFESKYVCFSMHSTTQAKHWNYPGGWEELCKRLRKSGIIPVCIDYHSSFGTEGYWNEVPKSAVSAHGLGINDVTNYIRHSEFFIGLSSGLSWVAHALGKKVVMISGVTSEDHEFSEDTIRFINKEVCHGCFNTKGIAFDISDWVWCPLHKNTDRQFECSTVITPQEVMDTIQAELLSKLELSPPEEDIEKNIKVTYIHGPKVEVLGEDDGSKYHVLFYNMDKDGELAYENTIKRGEWTRVKIQYYVKWRIVVLKDGFEYYEDNFDCSEKDVLIVLWSTALGDNISWVSYCEEFRKKHNCNLTVYSDYGDLFKGMYDSINFITYRDGKREVFYSAYEVSFGIQQGVHEEGMKRLNRYFRDNIPTKYIDGLTFFDTEFHPEHPARIPMQKIATNILGLPFSERRPNIPCNREDRPIEGKYVCISEFASAYSGMKLWNNKIGWQRVVDELVKIGYTVVSVSKEKSSLQNIIKRNGPYDLEDRIWYLKHAEFFIGLPSGLSWLNWATGKKTVMIGGFSEDWCEFQEDNIRVKNESACGGCYNSEEHSDKLCCYHSSFCPENKNFECSRKISPKMVIDVIKESNLLNI